MAVYKAITPIENCLIPHQFSVDIEMSVLDYAADFGASLRRTGGQVYDALSSNALTVLSGPVIPFQSTTMTRKEMLGLVLSGINLGKLLQSVPIESAPLAAAVAFAPAVMHCRPSGYRLYDVGLNPERVLARGEWHRVVTSQLVNATAAQMIENAGDIYEGAARIERRWGWKGLLAALGSVFSLGPTLYGKDPLANSENFKHRMFLMSSPFLPFVLAVALTAVANKIDPTSSLALQYTAAYAVGPGIGALGLSVLSGYDQDVALCIGEGFTVSQNRYIWSARLLVARLIAPDAGPLIEAHICGIVAGLMCTYAFGAMNPRWRRRAGLGWRDLVVQGGILCVLAVVGSRMAQVGADL